MPVEMTRKRCPNFIGLASTGSNRLPQISAWPKLYDYGCRYTDDEPSRRFFAVSVYQHLLNPRPSRCLRKQVLRTIRSQDQQNVLVPDRHPFADAATLRRQVVLTGERSARPNARPTLACSAPPSGYPPSIAAACVAAFRSLADGSHCLTK